MMQANRFVVFGTLSLMILLFSCGGSDVPGLTTSKKEDKSVFIPQSLGYQIMATYPHDTKAYTQGLIWHDGALIEGTGQLKESNLRVVELESGKVLKQVNNDKDVFGEGITVLGDKLYQLTWRNKKAFIYDVKTLKKTGEFPINTEGWGITHNGKELIYSDGTSNLYFLDTATFRELRRVNVYDNFGPVGNLNELEWIDGFVFANRYQTDMIYKINPDNGRVEARIDFSDLKGKAGFSVEDKYNEVLNGIAVDTATGRLFITGKYWPLLFEIKIGE